MFSHVPLNFKFVCGRGHGSLCAGLWCPPIAVHGCCAHLPHFHHPLSHSDHYTLTNTLWSLVSHADVAVSMYLVAHPLKPAAHFLKLDCMLVSHTDAGVIISVYPPGPPLPRQQHGRHHFATMDSGLQSASTPNHTQSCCQPHRCLTLMRV